MTLFFDLEVYPNYFLAAFLDTKGNKYEFELRNDKGNLRELKTFFKDKKLIGYNVLEYDSQIMEYILMNPNRTNKELYEISQTVINTRPKWQEWELSNEYLDLMAMNHWGIGSAKTASLKWLQVSTCQNIRDLPYHWTSTLTEEQMDNVRDYCVNSDIPSTAFIYRLCKHIIIISQ